MQTTWFSLAVLDGGALPVDSGFPETVQANRQNPVVCVAIGLDFVNFRCDVVESPRDLARPYRPAHR